MIGKFMKRQIEFDLLSKHSKMTATGDVIDWRVLLFW